MFGIQCDSAGALASTEVANALVQAAYLGQDDVGIHLLGPLAGDVVRVSPPMTMTPDEARDSLQLLFEICESMADNINTFASVHS